MFFRMFLAFGTVFGSLTGPAVWADESAVEPVEIALTIAEAPRDAWSKARIVPLTDGTSLTMRDQGTGGFDDASFWEVIFNAELPYGPKEFVFDLQVAEGHTPLWGDKTLQPIVNGSEGVPALLDDGTPSFDLVIADDGKGFIPVMSGPISLKLAASDVALTSFAFMTAGAEGYDVTMSNFRVVVWPEADDRVWPQRPHVTALGYREGGPMEARIEWHDDPQSLAARSAIVTLDVAGQTTDIKVPLPSQPAAISQSRVSTLDLGDLTAGAYALTVPSLGDRTTSVTTRFVVNDGTAALSRARDDAWSAFYWITEGPNGPYPEAHLQDQQAKTFGAPDLTRDVRGGWLDAGDYGKYAVNGAYSASLMLLTGLIAPDALDHEITTVANVSADVPPWLRVVDAQLEWLLKMQRADGAVNHKATSQKWPPMTDTPEDDTRVKWLMPVTTTATADFAATMSLASKLYAAQDDPGYQARAMVFRTAAEAALAWLEDHPDLEMIEPIYDGDQYGGPYDDQDDHDERFFAYAAYAALVQTPEAISQAAALTDGAAATLKSNKDATDWRSVGLLGFWALQTIDGLDPDLQVAVQDALRASAFRWRVAQNRSSWGIPVEDDAQLNWGSNSVVATVGWHWLLWANVSGEDRYIAAAERQLHYLFGANPLGQTYITGDYRNATSAPHFRPWSSGRIALPAGFIAGGPNSTNLAGDPLTGALANQPPMRMYVDDVQSYATNEVAINWQSAWALYASLLVHALSPAAIE